MTTITRKFTKEQLIAKLQHRLAVTAKYPDVEEAELDAAIFKIALASLNAGSDTNSHPASGPLSNVRLHRIREILRKAAAQSDGGNLGYAMSDAVKAIGELLEVRNAEPVGYYRKGSDGFYFASPTEQRPGTIPLYRHAPPAPVFPDEMAISDDMNLYQKSFAQGHNACRAAIIQHGGE